MDLVPLYETVREDVEAAVVEAARSADYVTFTSASTVRNYVDAMGGEIGSPRIVSIGPVTSDAARELGLEVAVEAERHDPDGLLAALLADAGADQAQE